MDKLIAAGASSTSLRRWRMALPDPFAHDTPARCSCGQHRTQTEHDNASRTLDRAVEGAVMRALFPHAATRRKFLRAVGRGNAAAAIASLFPLGAAKALAAEAGGAPEKAKVKIGFIPITCATPLIMAGPMGFYTQEGLEVELVKTAGWALVRDKVINKEYDAAHVLSPMPLAMSLGVGVAQALQTRTVAIENINGQAITLAMKHKDNRDPKNWKGFKFAVPFEFSMHNFLLRYYLAEHGLNPDTDVQIRTVPPPEMVANLRAGNLDGYLAPDPFNQRAVFEQCGFIHLLTKELWEGHPCCAFGATEEFITGSPNTFARLFRAIAKATAYADDPKNREQICEAIAPANYLNQPVPVLKQVLTGTYADGLGGVQKVPDRIAFDPFPYPAMGVWILTQMKRWGYLKADVDYKAIAEQVFLATDARKRLAELGHKEPGPDYPSYTIMGKTFDPAQPAAYLDSFAIKRG
jgi:nitrate/nitrite transport system substrate-binding protein